MTKILGHRGIRQPENKNLPYQNTIEAINLAIEQGADGIETDVFCSREGKCYLIHDDDISKHSEQTGFIAKLTNNEIENIKIKGGYKIPALSDVLDLFNKLSEDKILNLEIKQQGIIPNVLNEIQLSEIEESQIIISSFHHQELKITRNLNKNIKIGVLFNTENAEKYSKQNPEKYLIDFAEKMEPSIFICQKDIKYNKILSSNKEKYFWTILKDDQKIIENLLKYPNVNLITDYPKEVISLFHQKLA